MKRLIALIPGLIVLFTGCAHMSHDFATANPETVLVTYRVKPGEEAQFRTVLQEAWRVYRRDNLVFPQPHTVIQDIEEGDKPRFVEIFTWVSRSIPEHAPESVKTIWKQEEELCERRGGHYGIEPAEVKLIAPERR
jgi:hypothetical protein